MISRYFAVCMMGVTLFTAQCSKLDDLDEARAFADVAVDANRIRTRVLGDPLLGREGLSGTVWEDVPTSGSAVFKGTAIVAAIDEDDADAGFALVGRSDVTVDFGPGRNNITGTMNQFQSSREGDGILDVSGELQLQNGVVGEGTPNQFTVDYVGRVRVEGDSYTMSGDMRGRLLGNRPDRDPGQSIVKAISAVDINGNVQGNGQRLTGRLTLIGEN